VITLSVSKFNPLSRFLAPKEDKVLDLKLGVRKDIERRAKEIERVIDEMFPKEVKKVDATELPDVGIVDIDKGEKEAKKEKEQAVRESKKKSLEEKTIPTVAREPIKEAREPIKEPIKKEQKPIVKMEAIRPDESREEIDVRESEEPEKLHEEVSAVADRERKEEIHLEQRGSISRTTVVPGEGKKGQPDRAREKQVKKQIPLPESVEKIAPKKKPSDTGIDNTGFEAETSEETMPDKEAFVGEFSKEKETSSPKIEETEKIERKSLFGKKPKMVKKREKDEKHAAKPLVDLSMKNLLEKGLVIFDVETEEKE